MTDEDVQHLLALDGSPGPALAIDDADAAAIIEAALAGAGFGPGGGGTGGPRSASGGGMAAGTKLALLAGAAVVVAVVIALLAGRGKHAAPHVIATPAIDAAVPDAAVAGGPATGEAPPPQDAIKDDEIVIDQVPSEPPSRAKPAHHESTAREATDLLAAANAKRAAREWRASDDLYARVVQRAPRSLAAQTALVASASLHLEHLGDPKGAAQRFRRALAIAPAGVLAEDARWGLAEAARASHDTAAEQAALDDFLAHHASSPLAERAKARRAELR